MKIPSYKFLPLMYQLAARMGTKMMGGLGFHEVLNNVSKFENQNTASCFSFKFYILLFHSRIWKYKKDSSYSYLFCCKRAGIKIPFCLISLHVSYSISWSLLPIPLSRTCTHSAHGGIWWKSTYP